MAASTVRCEALSDGVFAIAITLLVLELRLPEHGVEGGLAAGLAALWPSYLAFALSFFSIIVSWMSHMAFMRLVHNLDRASLLANALFLFYITCVPFSTSVLAAHLTGPEVSTAVALYAGVFILGSIASILTLEALVQGNLFLPVVDAPRIRRARGALWAGLLLNVGATLLALVLPVLALGLVFMVRVMWLRLRHDTPSVAPAQSGQ